MVSDDEEITKAGKKGSKDDSELGDEESEDEEFEGGDSERVVSQKTKAKKKRSKQMILSDDEENNRTYARNIEDHHASFQMAASPKAKAPPVRLKDVIEKHRERSSKAQGEPDHRAFRVSSRRSDSCPPDLSPERITHRSRRTPVVGRRSSPTARASSPASQTPASFDIPASSPTNIDEDDNRPDNSPPEDGISHKKGSKRKRKKHARSESPSSNGDEPKKKAKRNSGATAPRAGRSAANLDDIDGTRRAILDAALLIYRSMLASKDPFPDAQSEDKMARWAWDDACTQIQINKVPISGNALKLIKLRTSQMRGELVTIVRANINLYGFSSDPSKIASNKRLYRKLLAADNYVYKDHEKKFGLFYHPILFETVYQMWFKTASHEGPRYPRYFSPIRAPTIALVYAAVRNALDEWENGRRTLKNFQAKIYAPIYEELIDALEKLDEKHEHEFVSVLGKTLHERSMNAAGLLASSNNKSAFTADVIDQAMSDARAIQKQFEEEEARALEDAQRIDNDWD
ncbi:hypothetical protein FRC02_000809 [Tulasnella sp. 418]|nr:hypothetical protein FRC02_000809 [Tulasnella sp. 418]